MQGATLDQDAVCPECGRDYAPHREVEGVDFLPTCTADDCPGKTIILETHVV
jgi:hypothetical protein